MNARKLIFNRLTVIWSGVSRIAPKSKEDLFCKRWKQRENRKGVIKEKKYINDEQD
jgi:hypothetical protein